jgi:hypothetical protein
MQVEFFFASGGWTVHASINPYFAIAILDFKSARPIKIEFFDRPPRFPIASWCSP